MKTEMKNAIHQKIEELLALAKQTKSPLLLLMRENDENKGGHLTAYGSGPAIKDLIVDAVKHNEDLMKVMKAARNEAFPSSLPLNIIEALNSGDGVYRP